MNVKQVSHIGVAVESIDEQIRFYRDVLGLELNGVEEVVAQKVKVAFLQVGETRIELLEPTSSDSPVRGFLDKKGMGVHHLAFEVDDLDAALAEARAKGVKLIDEQPRLGAGHVRIAFLHPKSTNGVLTELCERHG